MASTLHYKPNYNDYKEYMEDVGWTLKHTVITEKDSKIVTLDRTNIGDTHNVIDIRCPPGQKISIMGDKQVPDDEDIKAYSLEIKLCSSYGTEISHYTPIRIVKDKPTEDIITLARILYRDVRFNYETNSLEFQREPFVFNQGVEIAGEEHFQIFAVGNTSIEGCTFPDVSIDDNNIRFSLEVDRWT